MKKVDIRSVECPRCNLVASLVDGLCPRCHQLSATQQFEGWSRKVDALLRYTVLAILIVAVYTLIFVGIFYMAR